jgi:glyoxylase-like metal-dependent hydrolase (beta-lactamase superfamily II)
LAEYLGTANMWKHLSTKHAGDDRMSLQVGAGRVDRVEEQRVAIPIAAFTEDAGFIADRIAALPDGFLDPATMTFQLCFQSWIIRVDGLTALVDPCNGNGRKRGNIPFFDDLDTPYLERLAACGTPAETIDLVFCTHMHNDHCGWNTRQIDGRWVPTFPNATYVFVDAEYARWDTASPNRHPNDFNVSVFDESVRPIVEAGQAKIVSLPYVVSPSLTVEPAVGHTVGHAMLRLECEGATAYFVGDVVHHPVQVFRPDLHFPGCDDLTAAIATRRRLFRRVSEEGAIIFPAHFAAPHHGRVEMGDDEEFVFLPGA